MDLQHILNSLAAVLIKYVSCLEFSDEEDRGTEKTAPTEEDEKKMFSLVESAPRITVHTLETVGSCTHEVAVPPGQDYVPLKPPTGEPAKTYKFTLDPFQVIGNLKSH